jgi:hypothetical protein
MLAIRLRAFLAHLTADSTGMSIKQRLRQVKRSLHFVTNFGTDPTWHVTPATLVSHTTDERRGATDWSILRAVATE